MTSKYRPLDIVCPNLRSLEEPHSVASRLIVMGGANHPIHDDLTCVGRRSPASQKKAVELMATYFRREFGYDFVQYSANEFLDDSETLAWLWATGYPQDYTIIGGGCFRKREWKDLPNAWAMQWIWLHPYFRRKGILTRAWPVFTAMFGPFDVEEPVSNAMDHFLAGKPHVCRKSNGHNVPFYCSLPSP